MNPAQKKNSNRALWVDGYKAGLKEGKKIKTMKKETATCNQCYKQLKTYDGEIIVHYCDNSECPTFRLYQFSVEEMTDFMRNA